MSKSPPIPPANRSDKGPGEPDHAREKPRQAGERRPEHPDQQGQQGNTRINTTHQGYQQDR